MIEVNISMKEIEDLNLLDVLRSERYETKPNMAKFLKTYISSIRAIISNGKVDLWPKIHYDLAKCIIRFKDGQTLIKSYCASGMYYIFKNEDEQNIKENDIRCLDKFFELLEKFRFIRNGHEDVKVFSTDIEKTNEKMKEEMSCIKEKGVKFIDYTPSISVSNL